MPTQVDIPGGKATFRDPDQVTVRHRRPIQILAGVLGQGRAQQITQAIAAGASLDSLSLSEREFDVLFRMNEATLFALLESWTLDAPLPRTAEEVGDMRGVVYDVLTEEASKLNAALVDADAGLTLAAIEDDDSPTGASAGSSGRSAGVARRAPSDHSKPRGGRSTGTARRSVG